MFSFLQRLRLLKHILTIREHPYMMEDDDYATWLEKPAYRMRIDSVLTTDDAWRRPAGQVGAKLKILYILRWTCMHMTMSTNTTRKELMMMIRLRARHVMCSSFSDH